MIPDRTDIYAMCSLCGVCVYNNGEVKDAERPPTDCGVNLPGCMLRSEADLEQSRVYAFRISDGTVVVVDYEDKLKVLGYSWRRHDRTGHINCPIDGKTVQLHRLVTGVDDPEILVDHRFHEVRDNRKSQLRESTRAQNRQNTRKRTGSTSQYLGVYKDERRGQWAASIQTKGTNNKRTNRHLGYTSTEWEAAQLYNAAARAAYGEFAVLNVERHSIQGGPRDISNADTQEL